MYVDRKWQVISHQDTINPFQASLVNYVCTVKLMPITVGDNTFIDWKGAIIAGMRGHLHGFYHEDGDAERVQSV